MALINCPECTAQVSDRAKLCPTCGVRLRPSKIKWFFIVPAVLVAAFLIFGWSIPENEGRANSAYRACLEFYRQGAVASLQECDQVRDRALIADKIK